MNEPVFSPATHLSIVWAVMLAVLTLVEWRMLDRDPMSDQIFLPFIDRRVTLSATELENTPGPAITGRDLPGKDAAKPLKTDVEIGFNGPLFLVCFFGPILAFHLISLLLRRLRRGA